MSQPPDPPSSEINGLDPAELLARGLQTVRPTGDGRWVPPDAAEVARLLPQYRIECLLGRGGMGAVYKGMQLSLARPVAIKLLPVEMGADNQFVARFQREARTLAKLHHSSIVAVYDFGQTEDGHLYFVMEYVDGTDLRQVLRGPGLQIEQALALISQICDALTAAHRQGVMHRDIKPENVLLTSEGEVKLADFGLARPVHEDEDDGLTGTNVVMGTPAYMAPEQHEGQSDHRTDIFALGVMLYEILTGRTPRGGVVVPPSHRYQVDVRLDEVVMRALQGAPELRFQSAVEMKSAVDRIRTGPPLAGSEGASTEPVPAAPEPAPRQAPAPRVVAGPPKRAAGQGWGAAKVLTVLLLLAGAGGGWLWWRQMAPSGGRSAALPAATKEMPVQKPSPTPAATTAPVAVVSPATPRPLTIASSALASDLPPVPAQSIAKKGELLFSEDFQGATLDKRWHRVVDTFTVENGMLKGTQTRDQDIPAANGKPDVKAHPAVYGLDLPTKDSIVEFRMRFAGSTVMDLEFDDRKFEGSHYGHLCRAQFRLDSVTILDERDGSQSNALIELRNAPSKNEDKINQLLAAHTVTYPASLEAGKWYTVVVETVSDTMRVTVDGQPAAFFKSPGIGHEIKSKIELGVSGKDGFFDDIKVWNAEPAKP